MTPRGQSRGGRHRFMQAILRHDDPLPMAIGTRGRGASTSGALAALRRLGREDPWCWSENFTSSRNDIPDKECAARHSTDTEMAY